LTKHCLWNEITHVIVVYRLPAAPEVQACGEDQLLPSDNPLALGPAGNVGMCGTCHWALRTGSHSHNPFVGTGEWDLHRSNVSEVAEGELGDVRHVGAEWAQ
jgi:hypothetical protein